jgi:S-adenosylmethionine:tRNA ribosyltransferase-isomerase
MCNFAQTAVSCMTINPKDISISDYQYTLPEKKIAKYPLAGRDESKLLIYQDGNIGSDIYRNIADYLPQDTLLVFNDTRVIEARILFQKPSGGIIEIFCLEPAGEIRETSLALMQRQSVLWKCLIGGASKWKKGQVLIKNLITEGGLLRVTANFVEKKSDYFIIEISWDLARLTFSELLHRVGAIPLPPYIKRKADANDSIRYQTIYAHQNGSVAAPTAGLHFTDFVFQEIEKKKLQTVWLTLHVGAGTFMPVKSETLEGHVMHEECIELDNKTISFISGSLGSTVIPVGTTSLRSLESMYWLGVKIILNPKISPDKLKIEQWEPYSMAAEEITTKMALENLLVWMKNHSLDRLITTTSLIIVPGYSFKIACGLITNFHQPQSTLLLLVAAMVGEDWKKIYGYALENEFRFLSYGDGSLLFKKNYA